MDENLQVSHNATILTHYNDSMHECLCTIYSSNTDTDNSDIVIAFWVFFVVTLLLLFAQVLATFRIKREVDFVLAASERISKSAHLFLNSLQSEAYHVSSQ